MSMVRRMLFVRYASMATPPHDIVITNGYCSITNGRCACEGGMRDGRKLMDEAAT